MWGHADEVAVVNRRISRPVRLFGLYVLGLIGFVLVMAYAERRGLPRQWVGSLFLLLSIVLYASVGLACRTTDVDEYYVAGRRIPAVFNGMATAADWMSAASFMSLAGGLYLQGFAGSPSQPGGLAYVLGWTGGFCLVALLVAPYLRRLNLYTVPDFFRWRFIGAWPRRLAALASVLCSFSYLVAQIYAVGIITSRLTGVNFEIGVLLGLSGVLVCSFLGGMRGITWTQVAQYVILLLAFLVPVSWLSYKQMGNPIAPWAYAQQVDAIAKRERELLADPKERSAQEAYRHLASMYERKLQQVEVSLDKDRREAQARLRELRDAGANASELLQASRDLSDLPRGPAEAQERWQREMRDALVHAQPLGGVPPIDQSFAGNPNGTPAERETYTASQRNFFALIFCLMVGTMGLPHLLTRFYTTSSVRQTRFSVAWALLFIALIYVSAPALAVLVKHEVLTHLVGQPFETLPAWITQWNRLDPALISVNDVNHDGVLQFSELYLGADIIMLATPELGGMPYVVAGLVAAGGLAAALSTADGLLLTVGNTLAHDVYLPESRRQSTWRQFALLPIGPRQQVHAARLVILSKFALLSVALAAAYVAVLKPAGILFLVAASFSLAAAAFVPAMLLGLFSSRTSSAGATAGMVAGFTVTLYYLSLAWPALWLRLGAPHLASHGALWWDINPVAAGVFGVPLGLVVTAVCSRIWPDHLVAK